MNKNILLWDNFLYFIINFIIPTFIIVKSLSHELSQFIICEGRNMKSIDIIEKKHQKSAPDDGYQKYVIVAKDSY